VDDDAARAAIERDERTPAEAVMAKLLLGRRHDWNPDVAMRYLPIVRLIRSRGMRDHVTDVGSGPAGIAPYLRAPITGVDTSFLPAPHPLLTPVDASVVETPFDDRSRPCVISVDMLEHMPAEVRPGAIAELVRIAGRLLVVAVPCGPAAEEHDRAVAALFREVRGVDYRYLLEHLEYGLPRADDLRAAIDAAMRQWDRRGNVTLVPNANLRVRTWVVNRWIRRRLPDKVAWVALTWLSSALARANGTPAYRQIAVVEFDD
jgi:hypothetical protein